MPINQPANQIKLTNVSIVRLKKAGKRFEVACYKNKVLDWRSGAETDLDEVVQIENIFFNVSKGSVVPQEDLKKAFQTTNIVEIIKEILKKGELQVGEKERNHELSSAWKEIVTMVCEKCVDPKSQRPYTSGMIDKAMSDIHYSIKTGKSAKSQVGQVFERRNSLKWTDQDLFFAGTRCDTATTSERYDTDRTSENENKADNGK